MIETVKSYTEEEAVKRWAVLGADILDTKKARATPRFSFFDNSAKTFNGISGFTLKLDNDKSIYIDFDFMELSNGKKCIFPSNERLTGWCALQGKYYFITVDEDSKALIFFA